MMPLDGFGVRNAQSRTNSEAASGTQWIIDFGTLVGSPSTTRQQRFVSHHQEEALDATSVIWTKVHFGKTLFD